MRRDTLELRSGVVWILLTAFFLGASPIIEAEEFPEGVAEAYATLSGAIRGKDLATFMKCFDMNFIFEARDGSGLDRGPWRRLWLERFDELEYERAAFEMEKLLKRDADRLTIRTRRVVVFKKMRDDGARRLEEERFDDTWVKADGAWKLLYQKSGKVRTGGTVLPGAAIASPRLAALAADLAGGGAAVLSRFWKTAGRQTPFVETIPGDDAHRKVTFLWRASGEERKVFVQGGLPAAESFKPLERLGDSGLWYRTERLPRDAVFTYRFRIESEVRVPPSGTKPPETFLVQSFRADPLNPGTAGGESFVRLPGAPSLSSIEKADDRPEGEVERHVVGSAVLDERRFVTVYTPPDYDDLTTPCQGVFLLDRSDYKGRRAAGVVFDNLIAEKKIPSVIVFMIHSEGSRRGDLELSGAFVRFVGEELVAWARENFDLSKKPEDTVIGGNKLGGALAAACAAEYPGVFGKVLCESGDFSAHPGERGAEACAGTGAWLSRRFAGTPKQPLRFLLAVGCLEPASLVAGNAHLRDVLKAKGYPVAYTAFSGNHCLATWCDALAGGLPALLAP